MFETSEQRIKSLKKGIVMPVIEQLYIETNCIKVRRDNVWRPDFLL